MRENKTLAGRYEILERVGSGGMAIVYRGKDHRLGGREVAIKLLHPHLSTRDESLVRFKNEADAAAKLEHDNILKIFDAGVADEEEAFIVMEFVRGDTLAAIIDDRPLAMPEIGAMVAHEVAKALKAAHQERILHRDVKPENVMIREDGLIKLMDFGIARALDNHRMTMTGALMGSPAHMAPEHIEGKGIDYRADVFSLGTLLYYAVTGELPFTAASPHALLQKILTGTFDSARVVQPKVGKELSAIIDKALARNPEDRYQSAKELQEALGEYLDGMGIPDPGRGLKKWIKNQANYEKQIKETVISRLLERAQKRMGSMKRARSIDDLNRILALDPNHDGAREVLEKLNVIVRRRAKVRRGFILAGTAAVTLAALTFGTYISTDDDQEVESGVSPVEVALTEGQESEDTSTESLSPLPDVIESPKPDTAQLEDIVQESKDISEDDQPEVVAPGDVSESEEDTFSPDAEDEEAREDTIEEQDIAPPTEKAVQVASAKKEKNNSATKEKTNKVVAEKKSSENVQSTPTGKQLFPILVKTVPPAATLILDGKPRPELSTGPKTLKLRAGKHQYRVEFPQCPLCAPVTSSFTIDPENPIRERVFQIGLKPATLQLECEPQARVWIDNRAKGRTGKPIRVDIPFKDRAVGREVSVRLASTGYQEKRLKVRVRPGQLTHETILLTPSEPSTP